jgi:elongation factor P
LLLQWTHQSPRFFVELVDFRQLAAHGAIATFAAGDEGWGLLSFHSSEKLSKGGGCWQVCGDKCPLTQWTCILRAALLHRPQPIFHEGMTMRIDGSSVRAGMVVEYENKLWMVVNHEIRTPGNLRSFNQVEFKDIKTGTKKNLRLRPDEGVERVSLDQRDFQYLYREGDDLVFMDQENYEQITMKADFLGDRVAFMQDGMVVQVELHEGNPIGVKLPDTVILEIVEADPVVKGQTASSSYKPAKLENGIRVMVPPFITTGEKIVVNTNELTYVERAK